MSDLTEQQIGAMWEAFSRSLAELMENTHPEQARAFAAWAARPETHGSMVARGRMAILDPDSLPAHPVWDEIVERLVSEAQARAASRH